MRELGKKFIVQKELFGILAIQAYRIFSTCRYLDVDSGEANISFLDISAFLSKKSSRYLDIVKNSLCKYFHIFSSDSNLTLKVQ
jgi:hypothetical protein